MISPLIHEVEVLHQQVMQEGFDNSRRREFWHLVHRAKIQYDKIPSPLAEMLGDLRHLMIENRRWNLTRAVLVWFVIPFFLALLGVSWWFLNDRFGGIYSVGETVSWDYLVAGGGMGRLLVWGVGWGVLTDRSHTLTHVLVGRLLGIRFRSMFSSGWLPQTFPVILEMDYATYLGAGSARRQIMHISGTVVPFIVVLVWFVATDAWFSMVLPPLILAFFLIVVRKGYANDIKYFIRERLYSTRHRQLMRAP